MHDQLASTVSLARQLLTEIDPAREQATVRAPALKLVLDTFIELAGMQPSPLPAAVPSPSQRAVADQARRTVAGRIAEFEAERDPFEEPPRGRL